MRKLAIAAFVLTLSGCTRTPEKLEIVSVLPLALFPGCAKVFVRPPDGLCQSITVCIDGRETWHSSSFWPATCAMDRKSER